MVWNLVCWYKLQFRNLSVLVFFFFLTLKKICDIYKLLGKLQIYLLLEFYFIITRLFRQLNYWQSASYTIFLATHVDLHDLLSAWTCLSELQSAASTFYFKLATGQTTAQWGQTLITATTQREQSTLATQLRRRVSKPESSGLFYWNQYVSLYKLQNQKFWILTFFLMFENSKFSYQMLRINNLKLNF